MSLANIASALQGELVGADARFQRVSTDTRDIKAGDLFVALVGERFDGHDFIAEAGAGKASAVLVSRQVDIELPQLKVADTRIALGKLAELQRDAFAGSVAAITGSSGKTTTKEMLASILRCRSGGSSGNTEKVLATQGNFNNEIGVPLTLLGLRADQDFAVIELGASAAGDVAYLVQLVKPHVAMITNVMPAHVEGFGSIEAIAEAKAEIYQGLTEQGTAIINSDDGFASYWQSIVGDTQTLTFSGRGNNSADIYACDPQLSPRGSRFTLCTPIGETPITLALLGRHNVSNAVAACAAAYILGADLEDMKSGLSSVQPLNGRLKSHQNNSGAVVIDDSYNANPGSCRSAIDVLEQFAGRRILVLGDMAELGAEAEKHHQEVGQYAKDKKIDALFSVGTYGQLVADAFGKEGHCFPNKAELIQAARSMLAKDAVVLVKGSRSSAMEEVVEALTSVQSKENTQPKGNGQSNGQGG